MTNPLQEKKIKEFRELYFSRDNNMKFPTIEKYEAWLTTTLEEVYKAGEKNGLSRAVEAVKGLTLWDRLPAEIKKEALKAIESLN